MIEIYRPESEGQLLLLRSILDDAGLRFFVKNEAFGSLMVGPQIEHYNRKGLFVHPDDAEEAHQLVKEFFERTGHPKDHPSPGNADILRMVVEFFLFDWFIPGRRRRIEDLADDTGRPALRLVRGGRLRHRVRTGIETHDGARPADDRPADEQPDVDYSEDDP